MNELNEQKNDFTAINTCIAVPHPPLCNLVRNNNDNYSHITVNLMRLFTARINYSNWSVSRSDSIATNKNTEV